LADLEDNLDVMKYLVDKGADVNSRNYCGVSVLTQHCVYAVTLKCCCVVWKPYIV